MWLPDYINGDGGHQLSYKGRVLVINNLAASTMWHKLMVVEAPEELVGSIQKTLIDFFWNCKHWIRAGQLYLPPCEGGQLDRY